MIFNERQYKITGKQVSDLRFALDSNDTSDIPEWLAKAQRDALESQISDLKSQLVEYDLIKSGQTRFYECSDLTSLPKVLIQSRIAKGLSQKDLAVELGMTAQQIQRYEATNYMGASLARLIDVSQVLEVKITEAWGGERGNSSDSFFVWQDVTQVDWNSFPTKEMIGRGWIEAANDSDLAGLAMDYFERAAGPNFATAMHRKKFHGGNQPKRYSLLAWQARILEKARVEVTSGRVSEFLFDDSWVSELVRLSVERAAPLAARHFLASKGIVLVVEGHLQGTYLDGAAMLLETGNPVIGLTLRHDRLDNFWFVLLHELGHVFLHLFESLDMDFFDEESAEGNDDIEREADNFALDVLIPAEQWDLCMSRFSMTEESVLIDAENLNIHPSIIAGRVRKESNNYTKFGGLVGQGGVRELFGEDI